jgi:hypothetical protein
VLTLLLVVLLAGCGDLPRPFAGRPGATARRLSQPPPARLAVVSPTGALLGDKAAATLATAVALALAAKEVPALAEPARKGDWRLVLSASSAGAEVVPAYTVLDPKGETKGSVRGAPVDAAVWARGDTVTLARIASHDAVPIAALLTRIEAARQRSDPNSLLNRAIRVAVLPVTGAPGDGDAALLRQMKRELPKFGLVVEETPDAADFTIAGTVAITPKGANEGVEITWSVHDMQKHDLGTVSQLHDMPKGTLSGFWGDVAVVVAEQAAGGINDVILNGTGKRKPAPPAAP